MFNPAFGEEPFSKMNMVDQYLPSGDGGHSAVLTHPGETGEAAGFSISLRDLYSMAWRQRWLVAAITAAALLIGLVVTLLATPIYQAGATVQIRQETTNIVSGQDVNPQDVVSDASRYLKTQEQIIGSRAMAIAVARSLGLAKDDRFLVAMGAKPLSPEVPAAQRDAVRTEAVVGQLMANLGAKVPLDSRVATISFSSPDPVTAARVAQSFAVNYVQSTINTSFQSTSYARSFLLGQVNQARGRLSASERAAIDYARNTQLIDASDAASSSSDSEQRAGHSLTTASLVKLNEDLNAAKSQRIAAQQRWQVAQSTPALELPEVAQNATVISLQNDRATTDAQLQQLRTRYRPDRPEVQEVAARLAAIDRQIQRISGNARDTLRNAADVAAGNERQLAGAMDAARHEVLAEQQRRVQLNLLSQDVETNRQTLNDLLKRFNEINAAAGITANNLSLVDSAQVPGGPVRPRPLYNMAIALLAGLALGFGAALVREAIDDTVRSPDDVERKLQQAVLGATPKVKASSRSDTLSTLADPASMLSESYFSIRAALDYSTPHGRPKTILVTSSASGEGKSTTALALALDYARIGLRTVLIDADLRRPNVHRLAQLPNRHGFIDVLMEHAKLEDVVQHVADSTLDIVTLGRIVPNPAHVLSGEGVANVIAPYRERYDVMIFDSAPIMGIADTPLIARIIEGTVVVVEAGRAHRGQAKTTLKRIREVGGNVVGIVLSKFDSRDAGYGYGYYAYNYTYSDKKPVEDE